MERSRHVFLAAEGKIMEIAEYEKMYKLEGDYWWWVGRRKLIKNILDKLDLNSAAILDAGCGTGINLKYLSGYGAAIGVDSSRDALNFCRKRGIKNVSQGDAERLSFRDNTFDLITALDLLEHLDDNQALRGFYRVLKPNGYLVLTVPAFNFMWSPHDEAAHHKRRYNRRQLKTILEANGFIIEKLSHWNFFFFLPVVLMRLLKRSRKNQEVKTDVAELPDIINSLFTSILEFESCLIRRLNLPFGVSLVCLARVHK
jgi:ubiquinone/menaquinone biosynthesis C-methylase UbiE